MHREPGGERYYYTGVVLKADDAAYWWRAIATKDSGETANTSGQESGRTFAIAWKDESGAYALPLVRMRRALVTAYRDEAGQMTTFRWSDEERLLLGMTDAQGGKWRYP